MLFIIFTLFTIVIIFLLLYFATTGFGIDHPSPRAHMWIYLIIVLILGISNFFLLKTTSSRVDMVFTLWEFTFLFTILLGAILALIFGPIICIRRLNDLNRSRWWVILWFIPVLGILLLLALLLLRGESEKTYRIAV